MEKMVGYGGRADGCGGLFLRGLSRAEAEGRPASGGHEGASRQHGPPVAAPGLSLKILTSSRIFCSSLARISLFANSPSLQFFVVRL
ncbi:hypothetical protein BKA81DRAFT_369405 [Phyllosticta paracitricarpa]